MDSRTAEPTTRGKTIRRWARFYDAVAWAMSLGRGGAIRDTAAKFAEIGDRERVLDVGCGTGALAFAAKARTPGAVVYGIDASPEMIDVARRKAGRRRMPVEFEVAAIESLPFGNGEFDVVLSSLMLHHLPPDVKQAGLAEVVRVLKPGGRMVVVDFAGAGHGPIGHVAALFGHGHTHGVVEDLLEAIRAAGFSQVEVAATRFKSLVFVLARIEPAAGVGDATG